MGNLASLDFVLRDSSVDISLLSLRMLEYPTLLYALGSPTLFHLFAVCSSHQAEFNAQWRSIGFDNLQLALKGVLRDLSKNPSSLGSQHQSLNSNDQHSCFNHFSPLCSVCLKVVLAVYAGCMTSPYTPMYEWLTSQNDGGVGTQETELGDDSQIVSLAANGHISS
eukprot:Gb_21625 [translate_table: standard]